VDNIKIQTFDTPYKTGFTSSAATFTVFNPSFGVKQSLTRGLRAHGTVGRAFVPANASSLTGYNESIIGGRTQITQGNPNLKPEHSVTFDTGLEWTSRSTRVDVTYFQTKVNDRIISNVVISNPPPPAPVIVSYANAFEARMRGADVDIQQRFNRHLSAFASATRYFTRKEQISATTFRTILVVASYSARAGVDLDLGHVTSRLSTRYIRGRYDLDFNTAGNPLIPYENFAIVDLNAVYRLPNRQTVSIGVNNLFDKYYYEKLGFPLAGRAVTVRYGLTIGGDSTR
jgi:vitamin B12 transporter